MRKSKILKRITAAFLMLLMLFSAVGCGKQKAEIVMELGDQRITANMYRLWLSRVKGAYGTSDNSIWDQKNDDGRTYNEVFTSFVTDNAKTFVSAMHLFDQLGLKLPEEKQDEIDKTMKTILDERGGGSKSKLNSLLLPYGVNYDILREIYVIEEKLDHLEDYLYGENGVERISTEEKNKYYEENYVRIKQIFLYTSNKPITDDEGNYTYDESGNVATRDFTDAEIEAQEKEADEIMASLEAGGDFAALMTKHSEDKANAEYPNGYYFTKTSQYVEQVVEAAFDLEVGGTVKVKSDYGIHIILREELDEGGYADSKNSDFFTDFETTLVNLRLSERLAEFNDSIVVHQEAISKYNIKNSSINTTY